jgi:hypothetical protein
MRRLTRGVSRFGSIRGYTQQPSGQGPFQLGKALRLVQELPSPTDAISRVSVALGLTEPPSMDKLTSVIKEIDNKWDYDAHVKFNKALLENIQVVTKEFILEQCQHTDHLGKFFSYNKHLAINIDFIKQLIDKGANIAYFIRSVNEINQSIRVDGKIDPSLLEIQFKHLHANKSSVGVMGYVPEYIRSEYIFDDQFIERYMGYFSKVDWMYIADVRKADGEFIKSYWKYIDHPYYFQQCDKFTYDAVKQVLEDGYIDELTPEIWDTVLKRVEKDGQLELLYELCGSKIHFPMMTFEGDIDIHIAHIPSIDSIRDDTLFRIFDKGADNKVSLCQVAPDCFDKLNDLLKPLGMAYISDPITPTDYIDNMVTAIMATYALSLSGKAMIGFKTSTQTQCSNTLKRVLPLYLNRSKKQDPCNSILSSKN